MCADSVDGRLLVWGSGVSFFNLYFLGQVSELHDGSHYRLD